MRIAYVKSGDVVAAMQRLAGAGVGEDDGGPDGFLADLLRAKAADEFLLLGVATAARANACTTSTRVQARTLSLRRRWGRGRTTLEVCTTLWRFRPQRIICGKCGFSLWVSWLVARLLRVPLVHSRHNWQEDRRPLARLATLLDNWIVRRADAVACHGPYLRDRLAGIGVPRERTFEFDSGNQALVARLGSCAWIRPAERPKRVLFIGRVVRQKGVFDLLEACLRVLPDEPKLELIYVGDGPDLEALHARCHASAMVKRVQLLGRLPHTEIGGLLREARLVVTPTRSSFPEGRCMSAMEALALGVPVVAPDTGPFPYLVRDHVNGLLYPPDSVSALAACIAKGLTDEGLYAQITAGARATADRLLKPQVTFSQAVGRAFALANG